MPRAKRLDVAGVAQFWFSVATTYAYYKRRLLQQETVSQSSASFTPDYDVRGNVIGKNSQAFMFDASPPEPGDRTGNLPLRRSGSAR